jgi:hypothetical protein
MAKFLALSVDGEEINPSPGEMWVAGRAIEQTRGRTPLTVTTTVIGEVTGVNLANDHVTCVYFGNYTISNPSEWEWAFVGDIPDEQSWIP